MDHISERQHPLHPVIIRNPDLTGDWGIFAESLSGLRERPRPCLHSFPRTMHLYLEVPQSTSKYLDLPHRTLAYIKVDN